MYNPYLCVCVWLEFWGSAVGLSLSLSLSFSQKVTSIIHGLPQLISQNTTDKRGQYRLEGWEKFERVVISSGVPEINSHYPMLLLNYRDNHATSWLAGWQNIVSQYSKFHPFKYGIELTAARNWITSLTAWTSCLLSRNEKKDHSRHVAYIFIKTEACFQNILAPESRPENGIRSL